MLQYRKDESVATRRRVPISLTSDGVAAWDGVVTGIKAQLSKNGATAAASAADIVKLAPGSLYVELTQAELSETGWMAVWIAAAAGRVLSHIVIQVVEQDATAMTLAAIANAVNPSRAT